MQLDGLMSKIDAEEGGSKNNKHVSLNVSQFNADNITDGLQHQDAYDFYSICIDFEMYMFHHF